MLQITKVLRVDVGVTDEDEAVTFYTKKLGFSVVADVPFGDAKRWLEVAPPEADVSIALVDPSPVLEAGRLTWIVLHSTDPSSDHAELAAAHVDVGELIGGTDGIPCPFFISDPSGNQLMVNDGG